MSLNVGNIVKTLVSKPAQTKDEGTITVPEGYLGRVCAIQATGFINVSFGTAEKNNFAVGCYAPEELVLVK